MEEAKELTPKEVAAMKGVVVQTVYEAIKAGRLPAHTRPGTARWRIRTSDADRWTPIKDLNERAARGGRPPRKIKRSPDRT